MKKLIKVMLLLLVCVLLFAACDGKGTEVSQTSTTTTTPPAGVPGDNVPPAATELVLINADGSANYSVVYANGMVSTQATVVKDFRTSMRDKTGAQMALTMHNKAPESDREITVNVWKNRDDAAACYAATPYNCTRIEIVGNRIVVTAFTAATLETALDDLAKNITQNAAGEWVLPLTYSYSSNGSVVKTADEWSSMSKAEKEEFNAYVAGIEALPKFTGANLTAYDLYPLAKDGYEIAFKGATKAEYEAYVAALKAAGFTQYSARTVSAGSDKPDSANIYHTFTKDDIYVSTAWQGNLGLARITMVLPSTETNLPSLEPIPVQSTHTVTPTVAQMHITAGNSRGGGGGMSYVIQLADGKFIIVDGGLNAQFSRQVLVEYLETKAAEAGMAKPVIAMWIFSHVHGDHVELAMGTGSNGLFEIAKNSGYTIEAIAYNFPNDLAADSATAIDTVPEDNETSRIEKFERAIKTYCPNAKIYTPRAGQVYYFTGMQMEILSSEEDVYPLVTAKGPESIEMTHNMFSLNWRMTFDGGKSFMFLGDNTAEVNKQLSDMYGDYLKSDVLQMAHHGLTGGEINCYKNIDPDICLWATTETRFMGKYNESGKTVQQTHQYTMGASYKSGDSLGNPTDYKNTAEGIANRWIRKMGEYANDPSVRGDRRHYHNSQTTIVNAIDLTVTEDTSHTENW